jgi:nucleotide-binding universal stress UspA family protein
MQSIVVLIDHRPGTHGRVREAIELARRERARLTLLAAIPTVHGFTWIPPVPVPQSPTALRQACERECEALLRRFAAEVPAGVPVTMRAGRGRPDVALLDEVRRHRHDLVVLAPGWPGLAGLLARRRRSRFLRRCPARVVEVAATNHGGDHLGSRAVRPVPQKQSFRPWPRLLAARARRRARA